VGKRALDEAERAYRTSRAALMTALAAHEMRVFDVERAWRCCRRARCSAAA
jgi:hypothetical protein